MVYLVELTHFSIEAGVFVFGVFNFEEHQVNKISNVVWIQGRLVVDDVGFDEFSNGTKRFKDDIEAGQLPKSFK